VAWWDAGNVVVLDHVASGALYQDYTMMVFGNFNTFKSDLKLSAGKFYQEIDMKHIPCDSYPQLGWATEGLESSRECTGEASKTRP
jgi:hypothetical protein